jgi:F0F1-type ATP synthase assembly protein I
MKNKKNSRLNGIGLLLLSVGLLARAFRISGKVAEFLTAFLIGVGIGIILFSSFRNKLRPNC